MVDCPSLYDILNDNPGVSIKLKVINGKLFDEITVETDKGMYQVSGPNCCWGYSNSELLSHLSWRIKNHRYVAERTFND